MEQLMDEQHATVAWGLSDHEVPEERRPALATPPDWRVHKTKSRRARPLRRRLAGGDGLRPTVGDHHRSAERHAPKTAAIALAQRLSFFEELLCALLIDLRRSRRREKRQHGGKDCRTQRSCPHRPSSASVS